MNQNQETLGRYLIRERELRRVSADEIALRLSAERRVIDALEKDDFDIFRKRSDATVVVMQYAAYLHLDQAEVLRRFAVQWKLTGGVKRYPKLTHFTEGAPEAGNAVALKGKGLLAGYLPRRRNRLPFLIGGLVFGLVLFLCLPQTPQELTPKATPSRDREYTSPPVPPSADHVPPPVAGKKNSASAVAPAVPRLRSAGSGAKSILPPKSATIIGNRDSKRYHLPGMKYYDKVKTYHRIVFQSERQAINAGYSKARE